MSSYLTIDPGLKNCGVLLLTVRETKEGIRSDILWALTGDLSGKVNPDKERAHEFFSGVLESVGRILREREIHLTKVLIEFQPPLNVVRNPALVRWNSWVEAYSVAFFQGVSLSLDGSKVPIEYVHSNSVRRHFDIQGGTHSVNKSLSLTTARSFLTDPSLIKTDHLADCVLMGVFDFKKGK